MPNVRTGSGAEARFALSVEKPSSSYNVGHPYPQTAVITPPSTAPTVAANVGAGPVPAGTYRHAYTWVGDNDLETTISAWSADTVVASTSLKLELSVLDAVTDARVRMVNIYRKHLLSDAVTYSDPYWVGAIYDTAIVAFDDVASHLADPPTINFRKQPPAVNQTGANFEMKFWNPQSADMKADYGKIDTKQLGGGAGESRALAGPIKYAHTWKNVCNDAEIIYLMTAMYGLPDVYHVMSGAFTNDPGDAPDEPTLKYVWHPKNRWLKPRSLSLLKYDGGSLTPVFYWQNMVDDLSLVTGSGAAVEVTAKLMGCGHTPHGIGVPGTHTGTGLPPVLFGTRQDAYKLTNPFLVLLYAQLSGGIVKIKAKRYSGASYGTPYLTVTADSDNNQTRAAGTLTDLVNLFDEQTIPQTMGINRGSNRRPLSILFPSTLSTAHYPTNDTWSFPIVAKIPGRYTEDNPTGPSDDGTWTGVEPVFFDNPAWTDTSCEFKVGSSSADTLVEVQKTNVGLKSGLKEKRWHGPNAATPNDLDPTGDTTCMIQVDRELIDRYYQALQESDGRIYADWRLTGEPIEVLPGVVSTFARQLRIYGSQGRIDDTKEPISKKDATVQTVSVVFEQIDANRSADPFTVELITPTHVAFPAATA